MGSRMLVLKPYRMFGKHEYAIQPGSTPERQSWWEIKHSLKIKEGRYTLRRSKFWWEKVDPCNAQEVGLYANNTTLNNATQVNSRKLEDHGTIIESLLDRVRDLEGDRISSEKGITKQKKLQNRIEKNVKFQF